MHVIISVTQRAQPAFRTPGFVKLGTCQVFCAALPGHNIGLAQFVLP